MAGDQKTAAQKRTEALLAKDPDHFRKLAAKKKGLPNPSKTKFTSKVAAKFGAKGGSAPRRSKEIIEADRRLEHGLIELNNQSASRQYQNEHHQKIVQEGFKGEKS